MKNGSQWSKLSRKLIHRTEHCVKNRFFSLISSKLLISVKKIKKEIDYLSGNLLKEMVDALVEKDKAKESDLTSKEKDKIEITSYQPKTDNLKSITFEEFIARGNLYEENNGFLFNY